MICMTLNAPCKILYGGMEMVGQWTLNECPIYGGMVNTNDANPLLLRYIHHVGGVGDTIDTCIICKLLTLKNQHLSLRVHLTSWGPGQDDIGLPV